MRVLTFNEWRDQRMAQTGGEEFVRCPAPHCEEGMSECGECGSEQICTECDGEGRVQFYRVPARLEDNLFTIAEYAEAVREDLTALANWIGWESVEDAFASAGYAPFCDARNRTIKLCSLHARSRIRC